MWFQSLHKALKRSARRSSSRLNVETLADRCVPAVIADPVGDFLPGYTGPQDPGLDVVTHEVDYLSDQGRLVFHGEMAGPIAATQSIGGLYIIGVDRGLGTARFAGRTPSSGRTSCGTRSSASTRTAPDCSTTSWPGLRVPLVH